MYYVHQSLLAAMVLLAATGAGGATLQLDPGGTAFPYPAAQPVEAIGGNVVSDPSFEKTEIKRGPPDWHAGFHVYASNLDAAKGEKIRARVAPVVEMKLVSGRARTGGRSVYLHIPGKAWEQGDLAYSAQWEGRIPLPQEYPRIAVALAYRMKAEPPAPGKGRVQVHFLDQRGQPLGRWQQFSLMPNAEWMVRTLTFRLEKGVRQIGLTFYLDGCGTAEYGDLAIFPIAEEREEPISIRCVPMHFLDGTFALSEGDTSLIQLGVKSTAAAPAAGDAHLYVAVPEGVRFISWHPGLRLVDTRPYDDKGPARLRYDFSIGDLGAFLGKDHDTTTGIVLLAQTTLRAGTAAAAMLCWLEYAPGKDQPRVKTQPVPLQLKVLPPIHGRTPKDFTLGVMLRKPSQCAGEGSAVKPYAEFIKRCGVNCLPGAGGMAVAEYCRELGLAVSAEGGISNGYMLGRDVPAEFAFLRGDSQPFPRALCPTVIMRRLPFYVENVYEAVLRKQIAVDKTADGFTANWEPYMFFDRGCFCPRCKEEFLAYSKLPAAEVDRLWPLGVVKEHRQLWTGFSAWQHGRVIATLDQDCKRAGQERGIASCFIPQVTPVIFLPERADDMHTLHTDPAEYMSELTNHAGWGGYWCFDYLTPEVRRGVGDRLNLLNFVQAYRAWVDKNCPPGKRPRLHWLYHAYQGGRLVTFPEAITFDTLCCFVLGMDGAWAYVFPKGYDNRYWQALALAADTVAEFEVYVRQGRRQSRHSIEPMTPIPKVALGNLLRSWEFQREGGRLVAVANFWMDAEAFFKLKLADTAAEQRYLLWEPRQRRSYQSPAGNPYWTGRELASGVVLPVGAVRWAFFEVVPLANQQQAASLSQKDILTALGRRRPAIQKAYDDAMRQIGEPVRNKPGAE